MAGSQRDWWYGMRRCFATFALLSASALVMVGCDALRSASGRAEDQEYENFVDLAEQADELGITPYWLGRSFEAGGLRFEGPNVPDFGADVAGGGIDMSYDARTTAGGTAPLNITLYSPEAWRAVEDGVMKTRDPTRRVQVTVLGQPAELLLIAGGTRPVNVARLIFRIGTTTIRAEGGSVGSDYDGGPDRNPLVDPDALLAVLEQLRVWPE
jgi:hypothetical protein